MSEVGSLAWPLGINFEVQHERAHKLVVRNVL